MNNSRPVLTVTEAAEMLGISRALVCALVSRGHPRAPSRKATQGQVRYIFYVHGVTIESPLFQHEVAGKWHDN